MANQVPCSVLWAADNGRFNDPESYTDERYLSWLQKCEHRQNCIFAVAPDVVGNHEQTVEMSRPLFKLLRQVGYRPAFAAQDGWKTETTPWNEFDVFFIGGSTDFKLGTGLLAAAEAKRRKKWVHMGRVNSFKRLAIAKKSGCHSADGTFLKYSPINNVPRMLHWFKKLKEVEYEMLV